MTAEANPPACFSSSVTGTYNVLQAAKEEGNYRISQAAGEMQCDVFGRDMEILVLRLTTVYGPRDYDRVIPRFIRNALKDQTLVLYGGQQIPDFIHVSHVVDSAVRAGFGPHVPGAVNLGSGVAPGDKELVMLIADARTAQAAFGCPAITDPLSEIPALCSQISSTVRKNLYAAATLQADGAC